VTLGGELQLAGSRATSERLFLRALMIDARNSAALIGRAAIFERAGEWVQAVEMLEKLLVIDPSNAEARLRLGVCLRRLSRTSAARKALEAVTADLTSTWIRAIAWQELALAAVDRGDLGDAIRILQQGVTSVPDDLHLPVLLASTLDRQGRHRDARLAIRAVLARLAEAAPSARFQYSEWPSGDLAAARERLTARFPAAMAALDAALRQGVEP
ncbi:MAG: tetratricopeptide repeat protein, partial [Acidobacteria bacterium]|nr:tetratricopeptide repeat protein [Acidobacteriota bacterium]